MTRAIPADLDRRFRAAATSAGLVDVGFDVVDSPVGMLLVAVTRDGLIRVAFDPDTEAELALLSRSGGSRVLRAPVTVEAVVGELEEYFAGTRRAFDVPLDLRGLTPFGHAVLAELGTVPYGGTATYGELAERVGRTGAARAVGVVMNRNPVPIVLPCHRIVGARGDLVGYGGGLERKELLLRLEGAIL